MFLAAPSQPPSTPLQPDMGNSLIHSPVGSPQFLSDHADQCCTSNGRVSRSSRKAERMVPFTHGAQYKGTNVRLAGPVQTLLQLPGIMREISVARRLLILLNKTARPHLQLQLRANFARCECLTPLLCRLLLTA